MSVKDTIAILKQNILDEKAELDQDLAVVEQMETEYDVELKAEFDKGFDEGVKQNTSPGEKIYSEEELQAELQPLKDKIAELEGKVAQAEAELPGKLEQAAKLAVDAFKAELKAKYEEQQVAESQGETGFGALLS